MESPPPVVFLRGSRPDSAAADAQSSKSSTRPRRRPATPASKMPRLPIGSIMLGAARHAVFCARALARWREEAEERVRTPHQPSSFHPVSRALRLGLGVSTETLHTVQSSERYLISALQLVIN